MLPDRVEPGTKDYSVVLAGSVLRQRPAPGLPNIGTATVRSTASFPSQAPKPLCFLMAAGCRRASKVQRRQAGIGSPFAIDTPSRGAVDPLGLERAGTCPSGGRAVGRRTGWWASLAKWQRHGQPQARRIRLANARRPPPRRLGRRAGAGRLRRRARLRAGRPNSPGSSAAMTASNDLLANILPFSVPPDRQILHHGSHSALHSA
jgi:hypothetical protein